MHGFSNIFLFTDTTDISGGLPVYKVSSSADELMAITQTIAWRNRVSLFWTFKNFLEVVYLISQMKGQPIDNSDNSYDTYRRVAAATLGDIISFDMMEVNSVSYILLDCTVARFSTTYCQRTFKMKTLLLHMELMLSRHSFLQVMLRTLQSWSL